MFPGLVVSYLLPQCLCWCVCWCCPGWCRWLWWAVVVVAVVAAVGHLLDICWTSVGLLLDFCWTFAGLLLDFCWTNEAECLHYGLETLFSVGDDGGADDGDSAFFSNRAGSTFKMSCAPLGSEHG